MNAAFAGGRSNETSPPSSESIYRLIASIVFFASGFAALLYQVIWQRLLVFFSGSDVYSVTLIVTAFMAGLGIGNLAGGHLADRTSRRTNLLLFIVAELAIMLFGALSKWLFYDVFYRQYPALGESAALLWFVLFSSLLWPTFFMGASLPFLARALTSDIRAAAPTIGGLYGINTLGAAVGAFITSWVLLPKFGLAQSLSVGVALNAVCAGSLLAVLIVTRRRFIEGSDNGPNEASLPQFSEATGYKFQTWFLLYFLSGFVALSLEILWLRILGVTLKSSSFTFGTMLAIYLAGVGSGSIVGTRLVQKSGQPARSFLLFETFVAVCVAVALTVFISSFAASLLPHLFAYLGERDAIDLSLVVKGIADWWHNHGLPPEPAVEIRRLAFFFVIVPIVLIFPATFLMGLAFPYLQKAVHRDLQHIGRRVGALQFANILGGMAGTLLTGLIFMEKFGSAPTLKIVLALCSVFLGLWGWNVFKARVGSLAASAVFAGACFLILPSSLTLWSRLHGASPGRVTLAEDATGLSLMRDDGSPAQPYITVFVNGLGQSWIPYGDIHSVLGALPLLVHSNPIDVGVIGLGSGDTVFSIGGRSEIQSVLCVEILRPQLPNLRDLNRTHPDSGLTKFLEDKRVQNIAGDGRAYLMHHDARFDIIEADALRPTSAYAGNVFSREYFELLRDHLKSGGFAVTWIPTARVHETFRTVFPHVIRFDNIDIGSVQPIPFDRETVLERARSDFVRTYFASAGIDIQAMMADYMQPGKAVMVDPNQQKAAPEMINTDLFPRDEFDYRNSWK